MWYIILIQALLLPFAPISMWALPIMKLHWTAHWVLVSTSWPNMHIISKLHEICRLHSLIQGPTFSSLCNIASLAKNQSSICPDLAWTDKMRVQPLLARFARLWWWWCRADSGDYFCFYLTKQKPPPELIQIIASIHMLFQKCVMCCFFRSAQCQTFLRYQNLI